MLRSAVLGQFYKDLQDPLYKTPFAIYHRRYSTNTTPKWPLAQPMRCLGHNGAHGLYLCCIVFTRKPGLCGSLLPAIEHSDSVDPHTVHGTYERHGFTVTSVPFNC